MDIRNCKLCGKMFEYAGSPLCAACNKQMEDKFMEVKEYIRENPSSSIALVAEDTGVAVQQLKRWIKEERLTFSKDSGVVIQCEKCGASILTGRFCKDCKKNMTKKLEDIYAEPKAAERQKTSTNAKMRFIK